MGYRRQAREAAMCFLYQKDLGVNSLTLDPHKFAQHFSVPSGLLDFFLEIVKGVDLHQEEIDREIESVAEHWKLYRMERIDRAILRIATWELKEETQTPYRVILDEAVEIAKKYSTTESPSFVNGILDKLAKRIRAGIENPAEEGGKDLVSSSNSQ